MKTLKIHIIIAIIFTTLIAGLTTCAKFDAEPPVGTEIRPTYKSGVTTLDVTLITTESAKSGGNVSFAGSDSVAEKGICYGTVENPTIDSYKISSGVGIGEFISNITGLIENTTYYVRAYAISGAGVSYGEQIIFRTLPITTATVETLLITEITYNSATCNANICLDGGMEVTSRGICWGIASNPTTADFQIENGIGTGTFTGNLTGLAPNQQYYVRAFATNGKGTAYGNQLTFTTDYLNCGTLTDADGNIYKTVTIGTQCWMAENLKTTVYKNGSEIVNVTDNVEWGSLSSGAVCNYNNNVGNSNTYGKLYNWYAVADANGLCPNGWKVPSDADWKTLEIQLGMSQAQADETGWRGINEGGKLKEYGNVHWNFPNIGANNETGYTAIPSGYRQPDGEYFNLGGSVNYWITDESGVIANYRSLYSDNSAIYRNATSKNSGFAVRCVKE